MAIVRFLQRELLCKVVYYGPGLGGKTTNLLQIYKQVPKEYRGNLTSVETKRERTLFFDLLPLDYGKFRGFSVRLQLYTVPGQVNYNSSRRIVLKGTDGMVFVADSQKGKMDENLESLYNLQDNLKQYGVDWEAIPMVIQYNKRDLRPIYTVQELNRVLNQRELRYNVAIAKAGKGVFTSLKTITSLVIEDIKKDFIKASSLHAPKAAPTYAAPGTVVSTPVIAPPVPQPRITQPAQPVQPELKPDSRAPAMVEEALPDRERTTVETEKPIMAGADESQVSEKKRRDWSPWRKFFDLLKRTRR